MKLTNYEINILMKLSTDGVFFLKRMGGSKRFKIGGA